MHRTGGAFAVSGAEEAADEGPVLIAVQDEHPPVRVVTEGFDINGTSTCMAIPSSS